MPCSIVVGYQNFRSSCCPHLHLETLVSYLNTTVSQPWRN